MIESNKYNEQFYQGMEAGSFASAKAVLPHVNDLLHPGSVVDIGCGPGVWLLVWNKFLGITDYRGVEGPYIEESRIRIPLDKITFHDIKESLPSLGKFDLAMSLEVAEHLPAAYAHSFVEQLTSLSDFILFSAAIPGQGGTNHINEQYPEYWARIFLSLDYLPVDCIRPRIWNDDTVEIWYRQNILLYVRQTKLSAYPSLQNYRAATNPDYLTRVHPALLDQLNERIRITETLRGFLGWKWHSFKNRFFNK